MHVQLFLFAKHFLLHLSTGLAHWSIIGACVLKQNSVFKRMAEIIGSLINLLLTLAKHHQQLMCYKMTKQGILRRGCSYDKGIFVLMHTQCSNYTLYLNDQWSNMQPTLIRVAT